MFSSHFLASFSINVCSYSFKNIILKSIDQLSKYRTKAIKFSERLPHAMGVPGGSVVKNPPANTGDVVWSLGQEDPWVRKIPWERKWQPTPVFLPGKSHGQRSLVVYSPWSHRSVMPDIVINNNHRLCFV